MQERSKRRAFEQQELAALANRSHKEAVLANRQFETHRTKSQTKHTFIQKPVTFLLGKGAHAKELFLNSF